MLSQRKYSELSSLVVMVTFCFRLEVRCRSLPHISLYWLHGIHRLNIQPFHSVSRQVRFFNISRLSSQFAGQSYLLSLFIFLLLMLWWLLDTNTVEFMVAIWRNAKVGKYYWCQFPIHSKFLGIMDFSNVPLKLNQQKT